VSQSTLPVAPAIVARIARSRASAGVLPSLPMLSSRGRNPARACGSGNQSTATPGAASVRRRGTAAALAAPALFSGYATPLKSAKMVMVAAAPIGMCRVRWPELWPDALWDNAPPQQGERDGTSDRDARTGRA
jgi:hypothetical protein